MIRAFAVLAALLLTSVAHARHAPQVDMSLRDLDSGAVLPVYWSGGRAHVPGTPGHRYAVVLENRSAERVLAVLSIDGVNPVTGETANPAQSGYVLAPWQRTEVRGWRKDLSSIAEFVFTDLGDSYAARTNRPGNVGVIGVAVFNERQIVPRYDPPQYFDEDDYGNGDYKRDARPAAPSAGASAQELREPECGRRDPQVDQQGRGDDLDDIQHHERACRAAGADDQQCDQQHIGDDRQRGDGAQGAAARDAPLVEGVDGGGRRGGEQARERRREGAEMPGQGGEQRESPDRQPPHQDRPPQVGTVRRRGDVSQRTQVHDSALPRRFLDTHRARA